MKKYKSLDQLAPTHVSNHCIIGVLTMPLNEKESSNKGGILLLTGLFMNFDFHFDFLFVDRRIWLVDYNLIDIAMITSFMLQPHHLRPGFTHPLQWTKYPHVRFSLSLICSTWLWFRIITSCESRNVSDTLTMNQTSPIMGIPCQILFTPHLHFPLYRIITLI